MLYVDDWTVFGKAHRGRVSKLAAIVWIRVWTVVAQVVATRMASLISHANWCIQANGHDCHKILIGYSRLLLK